MKRELIIIGDRVLIKPDDQKEITGSGLYLPQGAYEKEKVHSGKIIKVGPGIPVAEPRDAQDEPWKELENTQPHYVPLQARINDRAIFLKNSAIEIEYEDTKYVIVPQSAILALIRYEVPPDELV
ncbi:MAG: co-chaperone GroES family protein [Candidatus Omnitrophica bacterium]|nr:co-chaperone GroES family protein [Candidatus Omnitrophota bacterium]